MATDNIEGQGLAARMVADIRRSGMAVGERYLTAQEAGERFGVSRATADRAMQVLMKQGILHRQRGRGTFVSDSMTQADPALPVVIVLIPEFRSRLPAAQCTSLPTVLHRHFSGAVVQSTIVPEDGAVAHVRRVLAAAETQGRMERVFAISSRRDVYQFLIDGDIPTVVFGSLFPDQTSLPRIEVDRAGAARLLAEHLAARGHRRFLLLPAVSDRAGAHAFHDKTCDVLAAHGLPANALKVRITDGDFSLLAAEMDELFSRPDYPTAVLADSVHLADAAIAAAARARLTVPDDAEVVYVGPLDQAVANLSLPHTRCVLSLDDAIARILEATRGTTRGVCVGVPVELVCD